MKWWAIYTNLSVNSIVILPHPHREASLGQETFLAPSADKQTCNYDTKCSKEIPSWSTRRSKGLSRSKIKCWTIYTNLQVSAIVRLPNRWSRYSRSQQTISALSADKKTRKYDRECSNHHPSLSTLRSKGLSRGKMKW